MIRNFLYANVNLPEGCKKRKTCLFVALDASHCFLHILSPPKANEINDILSNDQFEGLF